MENTYLFNSLFVLLAAVLVFMMQMGFACCEAGFSRAKNACNIWLKNFCDFCVGSLVYYIIGFGIMYGDDWHGLVGTTGFGNPLAQDLAVWRNLDGVLSPHIYLLFQTMFCATAATIISGAVAERFKFSSYLIVSAVMSGILYPVVGHWVWGGGWLSSVGFSDFAGSGAVHMVGGFAALAGAWMVGPRIGKYINGKSQAVPGHNIPMAMLGGFILWLGWYGFNPGSELAFDEVTLYTAITTTCAGSVGGLSALLFTWLRYKKPDPTLALNGALGALVAVCTGVAEISLPGACIIGIVSGIMLPLSVEFVDKVLRIDDPAGAISLHGANGILGVVEGGLLSTSRGLFYGFGIKYLLAQILGVVSIGAFILASTFLLFYLLKRTVGIRVTKEEELDGLDKHEHAMLAYVM
ncbi:MAG TPA: ammonium transporter [Treponema sp.]|nr:ammonium transporter [Treponema sp.]